jgi:serine protease inhibitor
MVLYVYGMIRMMSMFGTEADLSLISPALPLSVNKVKQKASLEVNERGAEGAAATVIEILPTGERLQPRVLQFPA